MEKEYHSKDLKKQTWDMFEKAVNGKKVVLFGVGRLLSLYFLRFDDAKVEMVIDNNQEKQGDSLEGYVFGNVLDEVVQKRILPFAELGKIEPEEVVVLISSMRYSQKMAEELEKQGFFNYFSIKEMEENQPTTLSGTGDTISGRVLDTYMKTYCQQPIEEKKIVIYEGDYIGHGKWIIEQLLKIRSDLDIVWIVKDLSVEAPQGVRKILERKELQCCYEMQTAHCWLIGNVISRYIPKREGQIYVQIKHWSSVTLKTFGFDFYEFRNIPSGIELMEHNSRAMDCIITGSKFDETTCRKGFHFKGEVFEAGSPRSDILFEEKKYKEKVYRTYNISKDKKILLYAPTFRDGTERRFIQYKYEILPDFKWLKKTLQEKYSGDWIIMLRLHPAIAKESAGMVQEDFMIDASDYPDSQELIAASDMMITDYSSIMFEPAFVHKPVFLFAPDRADYIDRGRKLLIDYDTLPFDIAESNEELNDAIRNFDQQEYDKKLDVFFEKYGVHEDGHASERAAAFISDLIDKGE